MSIHIAADPFRIHVADGEITDLKRRLTETRFPNEPDGNDNWDYGTNLAYLEKLVEVWRDDYDWRKHEAWLNGFPQFKAILMLPSLSSSAATTA